MTNLELARWYAALLGLLLVVAGLAGFADNPIVGRPDEAAPVFHTGAAHSILLVVAGGIALFVAFGLSGAGLANGLILLGAAFIGLLALTVVSPHLFGLFDVEVNPADHVLHAGLAVVSLAVGWLARSRRTRLALGDWRWPAHGRRQIGAPGAYTAGYPERPTSDEGRGGIE